MTDRRAQLTSDALHAGVVVFVVLVTAVLAVAVALPADVVSGVFLAATGYAAGRSGNLAKGASGE